MGDTAGHAARVEYGSVAGRAPRVEAPDIVERAGRRVLVGRPPLLVEVCAGEKGRRLGRARAVVPRGVALPVAVALLAANRAALAKPEARLFPSCTSDSVEEMAAAIVTARSSPSCRCLPCDHAGSSNRSLARRRHDERGVAEEEAGREGDDHCCCAGDEQFRRAQQKRRTRACCGFGKARSSARCRRNPALSAISSAAKTNSCSRQRHSMSATLPTDPASTLPTRPHRRRD